MATDIRPDRSDGTGVEPHTLRDIFRKRWMYLLILSGCIFVVFGRTLTYDFVTYDDYELVYRNESFLAEPANAVRAFATHAFTTHRAQSGYYRPVLLVSYIFDYQVWKLNPLGYHLTNVFVHVCAAIALFLLLEVLLGNAVISLLASLFFALHPVQCEAVAWIAGRNDLLLGAFILASALFYCLSISAPSGSARYRYLSAATFCAALFTKESAVFYLLLYPVLSYICTKESKPFAWHYKLFLPFRVAAGAYVLIRAAVIGSVIGAEQLYATSPLVDRLTNIPIVVAEHLKYIFVPAGYSVVHPFEQLIWVHQPWTIVAWTVTLLLCGGIWLMWKLSRFSGAGLIWFGVGLLPLLGVFPLAVPLLEHRLYLPMAGIAIALASALSTTRNPARQNVLRACIAGVVAVLAVVSVFRLPVWQNSETLWSDAIEKAPAASRSYFNLAGYFYERGEYENTIRLMKRYVGLKPDDAMGYMKLQQTYEIEGKVREAAAVERDLIECYLRNGDTTKAAALSRKSENKPK